MEEIYHPTGGPWGSDYIDEEFDKLLDEVFTKEALNPFREYKPANYTKIKDSFRKSKMNFYNKPNEKFHKMQLTAEFMDEIGEYSSSKFNNLANDDVDSSEVFKEIVDNAKPYGLPRGDLKMENDTLFLSADIWRECLFDKVINPMIDHVQKLIVKVNDIEDKDGKKTQVKFIHFLCGFYDKNI